MNVTLEVKKVLNSAFNCLLSEQDLVCLINSSTQLEFYQEETINASSIYLILNGIVTVVSQQNEVIRTCSKGFLGLHNVFVDEMKWQSYSIKLNDKLLVLKFDFTEFIARVKNYLQLVDLFHRQVLELDLLLLHYEVSSNNSINRINLLPCLNGLKQIVVEPGSIIETSSIADSEFMILHYGSLLHDSGRELVPGQIYEFDQKPEDDWYTLDGCCIFLYESEELPPAEPTCLAKEQPNINTIQVNNLQLQSKKNLKLSPWQKLKIIWRELIFARSIKDRQKEDLSDFWLFKKTTKLVSRGNSKLDSVISDKQKQNYGRDFEKEPIRVLIADDQNFVYLLVRDIFQRTEMIEYSGAASSGSAVIEQLEIDSQIDVLLLDWEMPGTDTAALIQQVCVQFPKVSVLVYSYHSGEEYFQQAQLSGAKGYLIKGCADAELINSILSILL